MAGVPSEFDIVSYMKEEKRERSSEFDGAWKMFKVAMVEIGEEL